MKRRDLIALLGTTALFWPLGAGAQQAERMRRIGVLMLYPESGAAHQIRDGDQSENRQGARSEAVRQFGVAC